MVVFGPAEHEPSRHSIYALRPARGFLTADALLALAAEPVRALTLVKDGVRSPPTSNRQVRSEGRRQRRDHTSGSFHRDASLVLVLVWEEGD